MFTKIEIDKLIQLKLTDRQALDRAQLAVDKLYSELTITALSTPLFPDKKQPEIKLYASNDTERKTAVEYFIAHDAKLIEYVQELNDTKRDYAASCERLEFAAIMMRLETARLNAGGK